MQPIEIFKSGIHTDTSGKQIQVSVSDLEQIAKSYDPSLHEAPLVVGHPAANLPAYGWVEKLSVEGDRLLAHPKKVDAQFAEIVENGRYKKRSASFYQPQSIGNPKPGSLYLRHVGFLGAQPPAVKGLKEVGFAETEGYVEFSEALEDEFMSIRHLLAEIKSIFNRGAAASSVTPPHSFTEPQSDIPANQSKGDDMSDELKAQLADEQAKREAIEKELAELKAAKQKAEAEQLAQENASFAEGLLKDGKLLPKHKDKVIALLNAAPQVLNFSEKDIDFTDALKAVLVDCKPVLEFSEVATNGNGAEAPDGTLAYAEGTPQESIEVDQKVKAYMAEHKVDYSTAFACVVSG